MKSILVINTPKCCGKCDMRRYDGNDTWRCFAINRILDDIENISSDCPLKPLPQKKEEIDVMETLAKSYRGETIILEKVIEKARQQGYNTCLDEILWGTENQDNKYQKQIDEVLGKDIVDKFFGGEE